MAKVIYYLFYFLIFLLAFALFGGDVVQSNYFFRLVFLMIPILLLVFHGFLTLGKKRTFFFIFFAALVGFLAEFFGLKNGTFFGGNYAYKLDQISLFGVPSIVMAYWAVFIYTGYCLSNSFLIWLNLKKPQNIWALLSLIFLDGIFVVLIDLFMDPIQVALGTWEWLDGGQFFGVPIGNFVGWFVVALIVSGVFRILEYSHPVKIKKYDQRINLIPVFGYAMLIVTFVFLAIKLQISNLAVFGISTMSPIVILNLLLFFSWQKKL